MPGLLRDNDDILKLNRYTSFMSVENSLAKIVTILRKNERLKRLLYYTDKHALRMPKLTQEQTYSMLNEQIKIVPKLKVDPDTKPYVIISLDKFLPHAQQTTFRSITLTFDILCAYDHWLLDDFKLRPYSIAGEIDAMINKSNISGAGTANFIGAQQLVLNEHLGGISLYYDLETFTDDIKLHREEVNV